MIKRNGNRVSYYGMVGTGKGQEWEIVEVVREFVKNPENGIPTKPIGQFGIGEFFPDFKTASKRVAALNGCASPS